MGVPHRCPRMGGWDKGNTPWWRISQSEIRKIAAAKKRGRGGNSFFPHPFFFPPRPSEATNRLWWTVRDSDP